MGTRETKDRAVKGGKGNASPLRLAIVAGVLLVLVMVALRLLPGSPFATQAAAQWGESGASSGPSSSGSTSPGATASPTENLPPLPLQPATVKLDATGWWSWALMDTRTGKISGSKNKAETSTTASLIKSWIGADFLRRAAEKGETPSETRMAQLRTMIRDSANNEAQTLYEANGGVESIERLIDICELTDSSPAANKGWSRSALSAEDVARLGACIADGRAAGPKWTKYLLDEMRAVRGTGDFGIRKAFPAAEQKSIAIKNGWVDRQVEQEYHVSCLAIGDGWTMGVMTKYPIGLGYTHGAKICQDITEQLLTN